MFKFLRHTVGPLLLIVGCPPFAICMWYTNTALQGDAGALWHFFMTQGFFSGLYEIWAPVFFGSKIAWVMIISFAAFELFLMKCLPGKTFSGPVTAKGNVPVYKANGVSAFILTMSLFLLLTFKWHFFSATILYDNLGAIIGALNLISLFVCLFLYLKGRYYPSSSDSGSTGNFIFDYYWGTELYPRIGGLHIKQFINCRFGMMSWGLLLISYAAKQQALYGLSNSMLISIALQFLYLSKFYVWETGYLGSLDIMHDRAGFYICWGCLVWVPCIYTSPSMYLVLHPIHLSYGLAFLILNLGAACIMINYFADRQRQHVRATSGNCKVWGKTPRLTKASYVTTSGEKKENLLLASGWWGVARHFHYVPEILGAFFWTVPSGFVHMTPYFYVTFLTILLMDRAFRDDKRCLKKYGDDWLRYCQLVPYKMIPYVI